LREIEVGMKLKSAAFSEVLDQFRRQEIDDAKANVQQLKDLKKISKEELVLRFKTRNAIRNSMKREYKAPRVFFSDRYDVYEDDYRQGGRRGGRQSERHGGRQRGRR
jgi:hypothetical protein